LNQGQQEILGFADNICAPRWIIGGNVNAFFVLHYIIEGVIFAKSTTNITKDFGNVSKHI
jgi:hypothetical protein